MTERYQAVKRMTLLGVVVHIGLAISKIVFGYVGKSHALLADGVHSFADLLADALVLLAAKFGSQHADADHPYGHARIETAASLGLSVFLILVGLGIIFDASERLWNHQIASAPDLFVLWIALFSVVINEIMFRYMRAVGKRLKSDLLIANALHSRSDAASSLVVLAGIVGSLLGFVYLDAIAAIIVGFLIVKMGGEIGWQNLSELVDRGVDDDTLDSIRKAIFTVPGVKAIHELRTRRMAGRVLIDLHIIVNPAITVSEGHHISERVMELLKQTIDSIEDITVHIDSENDEAYSSTSRLPLREELMPVLLKAWNNLPGFESHGMIRLDYLMGKMAIEVELPHSLVCQEGDISKLADQYKRVLSHVEYIANVKLVFI